MPSPTQTAGLQIEDEAERLLCRRGYEILDRNWRGAGGEIDRIAFHDGALVFVEIRFRKRAKTQSAAESVGRAKQARILRAAAVYVASRPERAASTVRFDVVAVARHPDGTLGFDVIESAFDAEILASGRGAPMV